MEMPLSDEELEMSGQEESSSSTTMSKAELRKTHKPIMEKRRRARINQCLNEIKSLILEAMNKDPARHTKLEKADILEMAVKHLQNVQRQQLALAMASDPSVLRKFKNGFSECAREIDLFMDRADGTEPGLKQRVSHHLHKCIGGIEQTAQFGYPGFGSVSFAFGGQSSEPQSSGDQNNNPRIQIPSGLQLIPSRLPTGELALLVPNSSNIPYFPQNQRPSAFAAVVPGRTLSPPTSPRERIHEGRAFKPVLPQAKRILGQEDDHQVPQVTSTVSAEKQAFIQTIRFPITKDKRLESPRKLSEPLSIITNQSERYKNAQMKEDSASFEENLNQQGLKRKLVELYPQGLFSGGHREAKMLKTRHEPSTSQQEVRGQQNRETVVRIAPKVEEKQGGSKDQEGSDMWRPW